MARSQSEITSHMHGTIPAPPSTLRYYFDFDEGEGPVIKSLVGYGYGNLGGGIRTAQPTWVSSSCPIVKRHTPPAPQGALLTMEKKIKALERKLKPIAKGSQESAGKVTGVTIGGASVGGVKELLLAGYVLGSAAGGLFIGFLAALYFLKRQRRGGQVLPSGMRLSSETDRSEADGLLEGDSLLDQGANWREETANLVESPHLAPSRADKMVRSPSTGDEV